MNYRARNFDRLRDLTVTELTVSTIQHMGSRARADLCGNPWFVAADVCRILDLQNASDAMEKLDADEKATLSPSTLGIIQGGPDRLIVSEGGYYTLVMRAREATQPGSVAHRFRRWVTSNVLPSIREPSAQHSEQQPGQDQAAPATSCGLMPTRLRQVRPPKSRARRATTTRPAARWSRWCWSVTASPTRPAMMWPPSSERTTRTCCAMPVTC